MWKEKRVPLAQARVICIVYLSSLVKLHEKEKRERVGLRFVPVRMFQAPHLELLARKKDKELMMPRRFSFPLVSIVAAE
jgi:hypothetical protein